MEPMRSTLRVVGVRLGAVALPGIEEALRQLQAEDNGMTLRQGLTHEVQVHRNAGGLKDLDTGMEWHGAGYNEDVRSIGNI